MLKITNSATPIHTINQRIAVVNFLIYHTATGILPGYVELVAKTLDGRDLADLYRRLYVLDPDKVWAVEYRLPLGVAAATITARLRVPYRPNHLQEAWLQATTVTTDNLTTTERLAALSLTVDGIAETTEAIQMQRSESSTEQRVNVDTVGAQLVGSDATGQRLSVIVVHAGTTGTLYIRTGPDAATTAAWVAKLEPGDLIELETGEAVQAVASETIPVNVTEVS